MSQDSDFCAEFFLKRVRITEALKPSDDPHWQLVLVRSCLGFARFNFALRTCSPALIVNAIAAFDKAMLGIIEVIWNRGFSESQRELTCLRLNLMVLAYLGHLSSLGPFMSPLERKAKTSSLNCLLLRLLISTAYYRFRLLIPSSNMFNANSVCFS